MSGLTPAPGAAIGLDHVGIVGADLGALARSVSGAGFALTPVAAHASGRTANRCAMLRDGGYLELMAAVPGQTSMTLDRFLTGGPGAHILALEVDDLVAARDRLHRAGAAQGEVSVTERSAAPDGARARFALLMPRDGPDGRVLLIHQLTRAVMWRPDNTVHPNHALALTEAIFATDNPAETMTRLSRLSGRPAEPDPLGGYRIQLARGCLRLLPRTAAATLFPGVSGGPPLFGLTIAVDHPAAEKVLHAGGVSLRFVAART
jgi:hypothetical protein